MVSTHGVVDDAVDSTTHNRLDLKTNHKLKLILKLILKNVSYLLPLKSDLNSFLKSIS